MKEINIAREFSRTPGARYREDGNYSGEEFRDDILKRLFEEVLKNNNKIKINLDGGMGYGTSFLEEVFGGLQRIYKKSGVNILDFLEFISNEEPYLIEDIEGYIKSVVNNNGHE